MKNFLANLEVYKKWPMTTLVIGSCIISYTVLYLSFWAINSGAVTSTIGKLIVLLFIILGAAFYILAPGIAHDVMQDYLGLNVRVSEEEISDMSAYDAMAHHWGSLAAYCTSRWRFGLENPGMGSLLLTIIIFGGWYVILEYILPSHIVESREVWGEMEVSMQALMAMYIAFKIAGYCVLIIAPLFLGFFADSMNFLSREYKENAF